MTLPVPAVLWLHSFGTAINQETLIVTRPQTGAMRIRYILIPEDAARGVVIRDLKIGNCSQFSYDDGRQGIPASRFATRDARSSLVALRRDHGPHPIYAELYASLLREAKAPALDMHTLSCAQDLSITVEPQTPITSAPPSGGADRPASARLASDHQPRIFEAFFFGHMAR